MADEDSDSGAHFPTLKIKLKDPAQVETKEDDNSNANAGGAKNGSLDGGIKEIPKPALTKTDPASPKKDLDDKAGTDSDTYDSDYEEEDGESDEDEDDEFHTPQSRPSEEITPANPASPTGDVFSQSSNDVLATFDFIKKPSMDENENPLPIRIPKTPPELTKAEVISVSTVNNMKRDALYAASILVSSGQVGVTDTMFVIQDDSASLQNKEQLLNDLFARLLNTPEKIGTEDASSRNLNANRDFLNDPGQGWLNHHFIDVAVLEIRKLQKELAEQKWSDLNAPVMQNLGKSVQSVDGVSANSNNNKEAGMECVPEISNTGSEPTLNYALGGGITAVPVSSLIPENENETTDIIAADNSKLPNSYVSASEDEEVNSVLSTKVCKKATKPTKSSVAHCLAGVQELPEFLAASFTSQDEPKHSLTDSSKMVSMGQQTESESKDFLEIKSPARGFNVLNEENEGQDILLSTPPTFFFLPPNRPTTPASIKQSESDDELNPSFYKTKEDSDFAAEDESLDQNVGIPEASISDDDVKKTESFGFIADSTLTESKTSDEIKKVEKEVDNANFFDPEANASNICKFQIYPEDSTEDQVQVEQDVEEDVKPEKVVAQEDDCYNGASILEIVAGGAVADSGAKDEPTTSQTPTASSRPAKSAQKLNYNQNRPTAIPGIGRVKSNLNVKQPAPVASGQNHAKQILTPDSIPKDTVDASTSVSGSVQAETEMSGSGTASASGSAEEKSRIRKCSTEKPKTRSKPARTRPITQPALSYAQRRQEKETAAKEAKEKETRATSSTRGTKKPAGKPAWR